MPSPKQIEKLQAKVACTILHRAYMAILPYGDFRAMRLLDSLGSIIFATQIVSDVELFDDNLKLFRENC